MGRLSDRSPRPRCIFCKFYLVSSMVQWCRARLKVQIMLWLFRVMVLPILLHGNVTWLPICPSTEVAFVMVGLRVINLGRTRRGTLSFDFWWPGLRGESRGDASWLAWLGHMERTDVSHLPSEAAVPSRKRGSKTHAQGGRYLHGASLE